MSHNNNVIGFAQMQDLEFQYGAKDGESDVRTISVADILRAGLVATLAELPAGALQRLTDELVQEAVAQLRDLVKAADAFESLQLAHCQDAACLEVVASKGDRVVSFADVAAYLMAMLAYAKEGASSLSVPYMALIEKAKLPAVISASQ
ncbi:hypothetical protein CH75_16730 [Dyella jiangningensis]|nr:hypothetical protein CH75_16730 [Dyella jiangningensis]